MADVKQLRIRELLASYGALDAHCKRVQQLPRVAEYFAHRSQQATAWKEATLTQRYTLLLSMNGR